MEPVERLLTISEAAQLLSVPAETLRKWCEQDQIPSRKLGRHRRIQWSVIQGLMDGSRTVETVTKNVTGGHSGAVVDIRGDKIVNG